MTAEQKTNQRDQPAFDMTACMAMMEKMMSGHSEGCDCEEMMSQMNSERSIPDEWLKVMSTKNTVADLMTKNKDRVTGPFQFL
ncbi:MAG: hypothetical protein WA997_17785 [Anaerolineales bacterium]